MSALVTVVALGLASFLGPAVFAAPTGLFSVALVSCGVLLSLAAADRVAPAPLAFGALAALAASVLAPVAPVLAGAAGLAIAFAPRAVRARSPMEVAIGVAAALVAGATATWVSARFGGGALELRLAAALVAALVAASPRLLPVDDPVAAELRRLARRCRSAATGERLVAAADLCHRMAPALAELRRRERRGVELAFVALARLARRLCGTPSEGSLDRAAGRLLAALERGRAAMDRREILAGQTEDTAATELSRAVDEIEAEAAAYEELRRVVGGEGVRQWPQ